MRATPNCGFADAPPPHPAGEAGTAGAEKNTVTAMNTGEFKTSINQMESDLAASRKKLYDKFEKLKSDFQELQACIADKNQQIAELTAQKKDLISLLDQAFAIIDDPSQGQLLEDLCKVETEVKTLIGLARADQPSAKAASASGGKDEPGEQAKKWAKDVLKGVGEVAGRSAAGAAKAS